MTITTEHTRHGVYIISVHGEMDLYSSGQLKSDVAAAWQRSTDRIIVDCTDLSYVDSSGVGVLLYIYTGAKKRNTEIWFTGIHGVVQKVIELTKLTDFLPIRTTTADVIEYLDGFPQAGKNSDDDIRQLVVDSSHRLFATAGMYHKTFFIDLRQVRRLSNLIAQQASPALQELNILEQQISELIKNAVRHGNRNDKSKGIRIWFRFTEQHAHVIVGDDGDGFQYLEEWNAFYRNKIRCYREKDFEGMMKYLSFHTSDSTENDGGNALMAAVEYWNDGVIFNRSRNTVAVGRDFTRK